MLPDGSGPRGQTPIDSDAQPVPPTGAIPPGDPRSDTPDDREPTMQPSIDPMSPANDSALTSGPPDLTVLEKCSATTKRGAAQDSIRRLTRIELSRVIQTAFPQLFEYHTNEYPNGYYRPASDILADYPPEVAEDPNENFNPMHAEAQVGAWMEISDRFGALVAGSPQERMRYGGDCLNAASIDAACLKRFVEKLGRTLFRRPLVADEVASVVDGLPPSDANGAIQTAVSHLLRAPQTVFEVIEGEPGADGRVRLTSHEVATRLAFALTGAPPDELLAAAADGGRLETLDDVQPHATRLIGGDLAKDRVSNFVDDWLRVYRIPRPAPSQAPREWDHDTQNLDRIYKEEILSYVRHVVWTERGTFADLMTMPVGFPADPKLADIYGVSTQAKGTAVATPDHPGLILRPGLLASSVETTSPILRGVTVLRRVLCDVLPSPDPTIVATRLIQLEALDPKTMPNHEIVSTVTSPNECQGCHKLINPVGFLLESFGTLGTHRTEQEYVADNPGYGPKLWATFPLPTAQSLALGDLPAKTYQSPQELVADLAESRQARACMAVRLFRSTYQRPEEADDACAITDTLRAMEEGKPLVEVFTRAVANEDIFWRKPL